MNETTQYGWICPKCGRTLAPFISQCPCFLKDQSEKSGVEKTTDFRDRPMESQDEYFGKK